MNDAMGLENLHKIGQLAILEAFGDAISIQDTDLRVLYQNASHRRLMGDHVGSYCYEAYQQRSSVCPECHLVESFKSGKVFRREASTQHSSRGLLHVEIISTPLKDAAGRIVAGIEAVRDITERKLLQEKLVAITADLERKTWKLMASNNDLEAFSYTLSHDISNYITKIAMSAEILKGQAAALPDGCGNLPLRTIDESCRELEILVDSILQLCSTGRETIRKVETDLTALAAEVVAELSLECPRENVTVEIAPGMVASGDRILLKLVLKNLFINACKYTRDQPLPHVRMFTEHRDGKTVYVLSDNGCGFDMKEATGLFKPFSRLNNACGIEGSGIGLATVRRVIHAHGGDVWGEGEPGKGAAFYFTLPE
jgi:signal transduction histidine kinase